MKVSADFHLEEFVPKAIFKQYQAAALWFIDPRIITIAQTIRTNLGRAITINNWMDGGPAQFRGFRPKGCTIGAPLSQHRLGRAIDIIVAGMTNDEVFEYLQNHFAGYSELGLTTIENPAFTKGWTHIDLRPKVDGFYPEKGFLIVDPK